MTIDAVQRCRWCGTRTDTGAATWTRCSECGAVACATCLDERVAAQSAWGEADAQVRCPCGAGTFEILDEL